MHKFICFMKSFHPEKVKNYLATFSSQEKSSIRKVFQMLNSKNLWYLVSLQVVTLLFHYFSIAVVIIDYLHYPCFLSIIID